MKLKRIASLTALLSFLLILLTSIVLYILPHGRVAYWSDWRLWGLSKDQWGALHINVGILFLITLFVHVYYNWRPMVGYLKTRTQRLRIFTAEFNVSLLLTLACLAGTLLNIPPFSTVMAWNEAVKEAGAKKHGEPPYGHAELSSLEHFAGRMGLDPDRSLATLRAKGLTVESTGQTLLAISAANGMTPQQVFEILRDEERPAEARTPGRSRGVGRGLGRGMGRLSLGEVCARYGLDPGRVKEALVARGMWAPMDRPLREVAGDNGMSPSDLHRLIRSLCEGEAEGRR